MILSGVAFFILTFVPRESTIWKMATANYITSDRVNTAIVAGKDFKNTLKSDLIEIIAAVKEDKKE